MLCQSVSVGDHDNRLARKPGSSFIVPSSDFNPKSCLIPHSFYPASSNTSCPHFLGQVVYTLQKYGVSKDNPDIGAMLSGRTARLLELHWGITPYCNSPVGTEPHHTVIPQWVLPWTLKNREISSQDNDVKQRSMGSKRETTIYILIHRLFGRGTTEKCTLLHGFSNPDTLAARRTRHRFPTPQLAATTKAI